MGEAGERRYEVDDYPSAGADRADNKDGGCGETAVGRRVCRMIPMQISDVWRRKAVVLDATAQIGRIYQSERLFFVEHCSKTFAVMSLCSDDAWLDIDDLMPDKGSPLVSASVSAIKNRFLCGLPYFDPPGVQPADLTTPYMGIRRKP